MSRRLYPFVFVFLVAFPLSLILSLVGTIKNYGLGTDFLLQWLRAFIFGFSVAYPTALILVPLARKIVEKIHWH